MKLKSNSREFPLAARRTLGLCAILCALAVAGFRQDMHVQPKYVPEDPSSFFPDGRSERQPVEGTVARGQLRTDELLYTGKVNGQPSEVFPYPVTKEIVERGQERYNVFCSPCHGFAGDGDGMIVQRGFRRPPSFYEDRLKTSPAGHYFDVISNGFGVMYPYGYRVAPRDRWAIIAYIRALQLSQHFPAGELTERMRRERQKQGAAAREGGPKQ